MSSRKISVLLLDCGTLKKKQEDVKQKLSEIKGSGGEAWEDLKAGVERALGDLKDAIGKAFPRFKKE